MNANYQHLSISAAAIILAIFLVAFLVFRAQTLSPELPTPQTVASTPRNNPDSTQFAPFQASENPETNTEKPAPAQPYKRILNPPATPQPQEQFPQFPRNAPRPLTDVKAEVPEPPPTPESIKRRREQRWAARISVEQQSKIDAVIDAAEQRHIEIMTNNVNRRAAIETVDRVTQVCFEELYTRAPDAAGRIIVNFQIIGDAKGRGIFENVHIASNYNLQDMAFEACVVAAIQSALFQALDAGQLWVEHALHTEQLPNK